MELSKEEKELITTAMAMLLAAGYNKIRQRIPPHEFDKAMLSITEQILHMQTVIAKDRKDITFIGAGLMMIANYGRDTSMSDFIKAGMVWYLLQKVPDIKKEFGIDIKKD